jgi:hypothetical protein
MYVHGPAVACKNDNILARVPLSGRDAVGSCCGSGERDV